MLHEWSKTNIMAECPSRRTDRTAPTLRRMAVRTAWRRGWRRFQLITLPRRAIRVVTPGASMAVTELTTRLSR
jgi:hypothetical protein